jgi:hypothetical protein
MWESTAFTGGPADPRRRTGAPADGGRLIRVTGLERKAVAYIVAAPEPETAIAIIGSFIGRDDAIEDLCRVSDALLRVLNLRAGEFVRTDGALA